MIIGKHVAAYTIREESDEVLIVGFRHAGRLPRGLELPDPGDPGDGNGGPADNDPSGDGPAG